MYHDLHLRDEETGAQASSKLPKFTQMTVAELGFILNQEVSGVDSWNLSHTSPHFLLAASNHSDLDSNFLWPSSPYVSLCLFL